MHINKNDTVNLLNALHQENINKNSISAQILKRHIQQKLPEQNSQNHLRSISDE